MPEFLINDSQVDKQSTLAKLNSIKVDTNEQKKMFILDQFLREVNENSIKFEQILEYFFIYVKYVLNHTRERYFDKLRFYEALVHQARIM